MASVPSKVGNPNSGAMAFQNSSSVNAPTLEYFSNRGSERTSRFWSSLVRFTSNLAYSCSNAFLRFFCHTSSSRLLIVILSSSGKSLSSSSSFRAS